MSSNREEPVRVVVGLGNPGADYVSTRHNVGFWLADELVASHGGAFKNERKFQGDLARINIGGHDLRVLKPMTFMNRSGNAVRALADYLKVPVGSILVVHDDLDLEPGVVRLKWSGGHGGHNGLRDLHGHLGKDYRRIRIGIGHPGRADQVVDYVLKRAGREDELRIREAIRDTVDVFPVMLDEGFERAMHRLHSRA